jgi:NADH:ubiquinone oxidoreductase subunit D
VRHQVPPRCEVIRVIMSEISRICDHLTCIGMAPPKPARRRSAS